MSVYVKNGNTLVPTVCTIRQEQIQYTVMPKPSIKLDGKIYQYIGETKTDEYGTKFNKGFFYCCVIIGGYWKWMQLDLGNIFPANASNILFDKDGSELQSDNLNDVVIEINDNLETANYNVDFLNDTLSQVILDM